jgi:hypothetical protein
MALAAGNVEETLVATAENFFYGGTMTYCLVRASCIFLKSRRKKFICKSN